MKFITAVLAFAKVGLSHGDTGTFQLRIDHENGHLHEGTSNEICVELINRANSVVRRKCQVPPREDTPGKKISNWAAHYWWDVDDTDGSYYTICNTGGDAFLVDQVKILKGWVIPIPCGYDTYKEIGWDNNVGWCLSTDHDDHTAFGNKAFQGKCERCMSVDFHGRWIWGARRPAAKYLRGNEDKGQEVANA